MGGGGGGGGGGSTLSVFIISNQLPTPPKSGNQNHLCGSCDTRQVGAAFFCTMMLLAQLETDAIIISETEQCNPASRIIQHNMHQVKKQHNIFYGN